MEVGVKQRLIDAALSMLEADGEEPSLRAVARAAGVSAMAPYKHFADKTALLSAVASCGFEMQRDALAAVDRNDDPCEALIAQGIAFVAFASANLGLFRLMYSHQYGNADSAAVRATYKILADRVAQIVPTHASAATLACRALVQGMATIVLNDRVGPSTPDDIPIAVRLLVQGFRSGASGNRRSGSSATHKPRSTRRTQ